MKKIQISDSLRVLRNGDKWVLEQRQAVAGKLAWNLAASSRHPSIAAQLGVLDAIQAATAADSGEDVSAANYEAAAALLG